MDIWGLINPLYSFSGFVVGMLVGFTGVGGGSLMTPLLVMAFGVHPSTAVGTDLLYAAATKTVGTTVHGVRGTVDWGVVWRLAAGSVPATGLSLLALSHLGKRLDSAHGLITSVLGVALIMTATAILFRQAHHQVLRRPGRPACWAATSPPCDHGAAGLCWGSWCRSPSVGAAAIGMTVLLVLYPKLPVAKLVGSDIAHAVPLTLLAGLGHWMMGSVDFHLLLSLLVGSIPGIIIGSVLASRATDRVLRPVLASALALVGGRLFF